MRILFTFTGGMGHVNPLIPIAQATKAAGHIVAFGCNPAMVGMMKALGFTTFTMGSGTSGPPERLPLRALDMKREEQEFLDRFVRRGTQYRIPLTIALCNQWHPDILVCDETDFGSMIAAEHLQLPYVTVLVIATGSFIRKEVISQTLNALRATYNLPPDHELHMLSRYLILSPFPPSYRDPASPLPTTAYSFRSPMTTKSYLPQWSSVLPEAPTLYFTLGTIFNMESGDLFMRVLAGLQMLSMNVIVTVGRHLDPEEFGVQPPHIHMKQFIPQALILPHCHVTISHGGSGSVMGALTYGLPSVLLPMGADQPLNANRCQALGVAQVLDALTATPTMVRDAVLATLTKPNYRQAAKRLQAEIATLPEVTTTIPLLEQVAMEKRPYISY